MKVICSQYVRGSYWTHSNPFRALLAKFIRLKPNKYVAAEAYALPDGTVIVDPLTYKKFKEYLETKKA